MDQSASPRLSKVTFVRLSLLLATSSTTLSTLKPLDLPSATAHRRPSSHSSSIKPGPVIVLIMSAPSFYPFIAKRPWLKKAILPIAEWYCQKAGYRQLGLRADDLIPEENDTVQLALRRLPPKEAYDRVFRIRRAFQLSVSHQLLPKAEWTKPEEDTAYLSKIIRQIESEMKEREDLESIIVDKRKKAAKSDGL